MGVRFIGGEKDGSPCDEVAMYCSTTETAFGPILPCLDAGQLFLEYLEHDARNYSGKELADYLQKFGESHSECDQCGKWRKNELACEECEADA